MTARDYASFLLAPIAALAVAGGCRDASKAPEGYGVVREHVISAPHNIPPIQSELDFTILDVDGAPVRREIPPPLVDMQPGALVLAGSHNFRTKVAPHMLPPGYQPHEITFVANVESGKIYYLVDNKDGSPILIELNPDTK
jgi:hypothetical protein